MRTAAGELFDIDTALRPNGNSGLLVTSIDVVRELPDRPRQQHRVDLGAPGADAGALVRRLDRRWRRASRRCAAPCWRAPRDARGAARRGAGDAREGARARIRSRPAASTSSTAPGGMMDVEFAVQYLVLGARRRASGAARQRRQHRAAAARRGRRAAAGGRRQRGGRRLPRAAPRAAPGAPRRAADPGRAGDAGARSATPCSRCGAPSSADAALARRRRARRWVAAAALLGLGALAGARPRAAMRSTGSRRSRCAQPWRAWSAALRPLQRAAPRRPTWPARALVGALGCVARVPRRASLRLARSPGR